MIDLDVSHVSKRYLVRSDSQSGPSAGGNLLSRQLNRIRSRSEEFWALRDVSFRVARGEALGIIGHNGAGKSTILKLLSSITAPTSGEININGRLSALIEVGSGFHPELSGRENVFLSGSILGMRRREIATKLESIVEFAGLRTFIDTPVKRYSSGMYVRLGFAIAAHLDPDILLLDEVLAVGDAAFQAKCIQRIKELEMDGTTIVFISHDLSAVERLCHRVILMRKGQIAAEGPPRHVIKSYHESTAGTGSDQPEGISAERVWPDRNSSPRSEAVRLAGVRVRDTNGQTVSVVDIEEPVGLEMSYEVLEDGHMVVPTFHVCNADGVRLFGVHDLSETWRGRGRPRGMYRTTAWIPGNLLSDGPLSVDAGVKSHEPTIRDHFAEIGVVGFRVNDSLSGGGARGGYLGDFPGLIRPMVEWTTLTD